MLHSYAFSNFQSFAGRVEVDLTIKRNTQLTTWMVDDLCGNRVSKIMGAVGHNASGKTALLKPVVFVSWFVAHSFSGLPDSILPMSPHAAFQDSPSEFECLFDYNGNLWRYELKLTNTRVLREALYQKKDRFNYVFIREWDDIRNFYIVKQQDFGLAPKLAAKVRQNVSMISWAAQHDVALAKQLAMTGVVSNINVLGRQAINDQAIMSAAAHFSQFPEQQARMRDLLASWDLGLIGVNLAQIQTDLISAPEEKVWYAFGVHFSGEEAFILPFHAESSGTQGAFVLLSSLLPVLMHGGLAIIDEFENDLHPHMLEPILELFANPASNPNNAQLLFSTHAIEVLNLMEKSQIMLVEKGENGVSHAYRLDSVDGIRSDDNYYAKYMAGAYGAVPEL